MKPFCFRSYRPAFSGYGYGTAEFLKSFENRRWKFTFQPDALERHRACRENIIVHSGFPHFFRMEKNKIHIGRVMLESDSLPRLWADVLNRMDEVWVASSFNVETFSRGGVDRRKLVVIPDMVDARFTPPKAPRRANKTFRFLSVFMDLSLRKGWEIMLYEFAGNFGQNPGVEWYVQCAPESAKKLKSVVREIRKQGYATGNITVNGTPPTTDRLIKLYRSADCYVLPTRGEGFGRPFLEASACGLPVIATGWSGQLDFLTPRNSRLLKYRLTEVPAPDALDCYFLAGQNWAEPSHKDLGAALREMLKRPRLKPVDVSPFREERVMSLVEDRLENIKKTVRAKTKTLPPQISVYDARWRAKELVPADFTKSLRALWRDIAVAGTGRNAGWLAEFLLENRFNVPYFIDRKPGRFMGRKVYTPDRLPKSPKPDVALISTFPASFPEWRGLLEGKLHALPVIFYRQTAQP